MRRLPRLCLVLALAGCNDSSPALLDGATDLAPPTDRSAVEGAPDQTQGPDAPASDLPRPDQTLGLDGPSSDGCPPLPSCNWCGGAPTYDASGCVLYWTCANGVNPCTTQPCSSSQDCKAGETCDSSGLCWPATDAGAVTCPGPASGGGSINGDCFSEWSCTDGNTYHIDCAAGAPTCDCLVNGVKTHTCTPASSGATACSKSGQCCGFPT